MELIRADYKSGLLQNWHILTQRKHCCNLFVTYGRYNDLINLLTCTYREMIYSRLQKCRTSISHCICGRYYLHREQIADCKTVNQTTAQRSLRLA